MIFAVAQVDSVIIYDTEQTLPVSVIASIHLAPLTDIAWSMDGLALVVSSADGYCSSILFEQNELGTVIDVTEKSDLGRSKNDNSEMCQKIGDSSAVDLRQESENKVESKRSNMDSHAAIPVAKQQKTTSN